MSFVPAPVRTTGTALANVVTTTAVRTEQAVDVVGNMIDAAHSWSEGYAASVKDNQKNVAIHRKISYAKDDARFFKSTRDELGDDEELRSLFWEAISEYGLSAEETTKVESKLKREAIPA